MIPYSPWSVAINKDQLLASTILPTVFSASMLSLWFFLCLKRSSSTRGKFAARSSGGRHPHEDDMESTQKRTVTPMQSTQRKTVIEETKEVQKRKTVEVEKCPTEKSISELSRSSAQASSRAKNIFGKKKANPDVAIKKTSYNVSKVDAIICV
ncbi:hypothetical protein GCK32_015214 [Trichostrongylus colubriformis]|uniref:Uncharacterized protein n=1 Tax=Trichostrongylus colubriformis TaxID=6319 RepID=A0AAN8IDX8_TRICO